MRPRVSNLVVAHSQDGGGINTFKPQTALSLLIFGCELERCGITATFIVNWHAWKVDGDTHAVGGKGDGVKVSLL